MRRFLLAITLVAGLAGTAHAQSMTGRDSTVLSGSKARALCAALGGMPPGAASTPSPLPPNTPQAGTAFGGPRQVWVNWSSKVYHGQGDRYYGQAKRGESMTEAAAKAAGAHGSGGEACS